MWTHIQVLASALRRRLLQIEGQLLAGSGPPGDIPRPEKGVAGAATTATTPMRGNYRAESSVARPGKVNQGERPLAPETIRNQAASDRRKKVDGSEIRPPLPTRPCAASGAGIPASSSSRPGAIPTNVSAGQVRTIERHVRWEGRDDTLIVRHQPGPLRLRLPLAVSAVGECARSPPALRRYRLSDSRRRQGGSSHY